jgi:hypothetical protein
VLHFDNTFLSAGTKLLLNPSWKNPSEEWHVGCKLVYELFTETLTSRLKVQHSLTVLLSQ